MPAPFVVKKIADAHALLDYQPGGETVLGLLLRAASDIRGVAAIYASADGRDSVYAERLIALAVEIDDDSNGITASLSVVLDRIETVLGEAGKLLAERPPG